MANEKISQFAIDADIEDVDGLAAMTITNAATADPAGGVPIEYGNVALPGYAFTLGNILKTKENRSDPDPNNWADVISNRVPRGTQSGTSVDFREGLTFGGDTSSTDFPDLLTIQGDPVEASTINFIGYEKGGDFQNPIEYAKVNWKYIEGFKVQTATSATSTSIQLISNNTQRTGNEIEIYAGRDDSATNSANVLHIWNRNKGGKVQLESANDLFIETGVASGSSSAGASKKLYIKPANSTSIVAGQVLTSMGTDGETEWEDRTTYNLITALQSPFNGSVSVGLTKDAATNPSIVSSITFNEDQGIVFTSPVGAQTASFGIKAKLNTTGGLKFSASDEIELDLGYTTPAGTKKYPVELDNNKAYVEVPWTDTQNTYTAGNGLVLSSNSFAADLKSNGGIVFEGTNNELALKLDASAITGTLGMADGGTGNTTFASKSVVFSNGSELTSSASLEFTESPQGGGQATNAATLKIGFKDVSSPTDGYQGVLKLAGQGDSSSTPYDESGKIELECQTGGHNFHIVGPDHSNMSYSPGIVLPDDIPKPGGTIVTSSIPPSSGSDRTVNTKWRKQNFHVISDASGNNQNWDPSEHYNAKCDFTTSGTAQSLDLDTMLVTSGTFQVVFNGAYGTLVVINGASPVTITFPTNSLWVGGSSTVEPTASGVDIYSFVYDGSNFYWSYGLDNKS